MLNDEAHEELRDDLEKRSRKKSLESYAKPERLAPCVKCQGERVPKEEVRVYTYPEFLPLVEQRLDGGYCATCATHDVERLYAQGRLGGLEVKGARIEPDPDSLC